MSSRKDTVEFQDRFFLYVGGGEGTGNLSGDSEIGYIILLRQSHRARSCFPPQQGTLLRVFKAAPAYMLQYRLIAEDGLQFV
jgi:hypothetical protein